MDKIVIKVTVYRNTDPELYDSIQHVPLRRRSTLIRRYWLLGLRPPPPGLFTVPSAERPGTPASWVSEPRTCESVDTHDTGRDQLNVHDLDGLSAFL
ncbi:MAG: hypothetical protein ACYCOU_17055 [Sulfobacillus sp.]